MKRTRHAVQPMIAVLPSRLEMPLDRSLFGYEIGRGVRIRLLAERRNPSH